jgi:hypothetical protein
MTTSTKGEKPIAQKTTKITATCKKIAHCLYFYELVHIEIGKNLYCSLIIF